MKKSSFIKDWRRRVTQLPRLIRENIFLMALLMSIPIDMVEARINPLERDKETETINLQLGTEYLTERKLKERIKLLNEQATHVYSDVYFGRGLWLGHLWNVQTGYGRWNYFLKDNLPSPKGKRILDLGADNAHNSLQLLRAGANEVIAVEKNEERVNLGHFVQDGFEWMDNKKYNLKYIHSNMNKITSMDLGRFDMVLALCSFYYLSDEEMAEVTEHICTITDLFVLECNTGNLERSDTHLYEKASVEYAVSLLKNHGFPNVQVIGPEGYYRPLVIGRKS